MAANYFLGIAMNRFLHIFIPALFLVSFFLHTDQRDLYANDKAVVSNVANFFSRYSSVQAVFSVADGSNVFMRGMFRYAAGGRILVDLAEPAGKKIVSNGRYVWVVNQTANTVGRQNLYPRALSGGLSFLNKYPDVAVMSHSGGYNIRLRSATAGWKQVVVRANKNFIPSRITLSDGKGSTRTITFANVKTGISFPGKIFEFRVPSNTVMVENPLNLK